MVAWLAQESDESMCKPSNLKEVTMSMVPVGVVRNGRFERAKGPSIISLVLVVFISMSFSFAQERRFDKKKLTFQCWRIRITNQLESIRFVKKAAFRFTIIGFCIMNNVFSVLMWNTTGNYLGTNFVLNLY